jgi:ankyrin repeat protein
MNKIMYSNLETMWLLKQFIIPEIKNTNDLASLTLSFPIICPSMTFKNIPKKEIQVSLLDNLIVVANNCSELTLKKFFNNPIKNLMIQNMNNVLEQTVFNHIIYNLEIDIPIKIREAYRPSHLFINSCKYNLTNLVEAFNVKKMNDVIYQQGLNEACKKGNVNIIKRLTKKPFSLDNKSIKYKFYDIPEKKIIDVNIYLNVCQYGKTEVLDILIKKPFLLNDELMRENHSEALTISCYFGRINIIKRLGKAPFNFNHTDAIESNSLNAACSGGRVDVIEELLKEPYSIGNDLTHEIIYDAFINACQDGQIDVIERLIQHPFNINREMAQHQDSWALRVSCINGQDKVLERLALPPFSLGYDDASCLDNSPIRLACEYGYSQIIKILGKAPYSLTTQDCQVFSNSPIRLACQYGHIDVIKELINEPYNIGYNDIRDAYNSSLFQACINCHIDIIQLLSEEPFLMGKSEALSLYPELKHKFRGMPDSERKKKIIKKLRQSPYNLEI